MFTGSYLYAHCLCIVLQKRRIWKKPVPVVVIPGNPRIQSRKLRERVHQQRSRLIIGSRNEERSKNAYNVKRGSVGNWKLKNVVGRKS